MPTLTTDEVMRMRADRRRSGPLALLACLLGLVAGCDLLNPFARLARKHQKPVERKHSEPLTVAGAPSKYSFQVGPYMFLSDFEIDRSNPIFKDLEELRERVTKKLRLPPSRALIQVYLFETEESFEHFIKTHHPELPPRRAFFMAQEGVVGGPDDLLVFTSWGDRIAQDLRHELTHAILHSVLKNVPIWLDEGLAEYFEQPAQNNGFNETHLTQLVRTSDTSDWPNLARLEKCTEITHMGPDEYRESWAWVHLMLHDDPKARQVLLEFIHELRKTETPPPIAPRLAKVYPSVQEAFLKHLVMLEREHLRSKEPMPSTTPNGQ